MLANNQSNYNLIPAYHKCRVCCNGRDKVSFCFTNSNKLYVRNVCNVCRGKKQRGEKSTIKLRIDEYFNNIRN